MRVLIIRLLAWFCDFLLTLVAFHYLLSFSSFEIQFDNLAFYFLDIGLSHSVSYSLSSFLLTFALCIVFRFYATILLGVSLSQFILGVRSTSSFIWSRLGGALRCALEFVIPLTLVDPFLLIKSKATLKETLTQSGLKLKNSILVFPATIIFIPICILIAICSPMFQNLTLIDGLKLSFSSEKLEGLSNRTDFSKFKHYPSETFKMSSFSSIEDSKLRLIPSFEITREKSKKRIRPYLVIHDVERSVFGELKLRNRMGLRKVIENISSFNPMFSTFYPELTKVLKRPTDHYGIQKYQSKFGDKKVLNPIAREELQKLIQSSFELSYSNLFSHIISNGPFLSSHIRLRNYFLSLVDSDVTPEVDLVRFGNYIFLRFKQSYGSFEGIEKGMTESYIPIETLNSGIIEHNWGSSRKDALARNDFKEKFLTSSKWFFDYKGVFTPPKNIEDYNVFTIMDFFTLKNLNQEFVTSLQKYTFGHLFDLAKTSVMKNDDSLQELVVSSCNRVLLIMNYKKKLLSKKESAKFIRMITDLKNAVSSKNVEFFEN
jgi:hypothetical protein